MQLMPQAEPAHSNKIHSAVVIPPFHYHAYLLFPDYITTPLEQMLTHCC